MEQLELALAAELWVMCQRLVEMGQLELAPLAE
jgi:hypothetical protein